MNRPWTRAEVLSLLGLGVATVACAAALVVVKEFRLLIGLPVDPPSSSASAGSENARGFSQPLPTEQYTDTPGPSTGTSSAKGLEAKGSKTGGRSPSTSGAVSPIKPGILRPTSSQEADEPGLGSQEAGVQALGAERVRATGVGFAGAEFPRERRKYLAKRAAEVDARRKLAEVLETLIQSRTTTHDGVLSADEVAATVNQEIRGARQVAERELPDGGFEVTVEMEIGVN